MTFSFATVCVGRPYVDYFASIIKNYFDKNLPQSTNIYIHTDDPYYCGFKFKEYKTDLKKFMRKSLFIQIDEDINSSTPIYINTEFFDKLDDKLKIYLGFGKKADQKIHPSTNIHTMPLNSKILIVLVDWIFKKIKNNLISILPGYLRKKIRK